MAAVAGLRGTGDWGTSERPQNFREMILWLQPNGAAPLTALMSKMKKESTDDPQFHWWEEMQGICRLRVDDLDALAPADTAVVVGSGALALVPGDMLLVEVDIGTTYANEVLLVTAVSSDTAFTVERAFAGSTAAAIPDNTYLTRIGSAFGEGTGGADASTNNPTKLTNYCEIFKTAFEVTETAKVTKARTGNVLAMDKKRAMFKHSVNLEQAAFFGKASEEVGANGKPIRTTGGLLSFLAAAGRIHKYTAALTTFANVMDNVYDVFDYTGDGTTGGDERLIFAGNGALNILNKLALADGTVNFTDTIKVYGMNLQKFTTPQGTFYIKSHPLMNQHSVFTNSMFVVDPPGLCYRHLRDTKPVNNIQEPDADAEKGQWLTEAGFEFHHMKTMKFLHNLSI